MEIKAGYEDIVVLDSITKLLPAHVGHVVIAASHGGSYTAWCAARGGVRAVVFNDAGVGWQQAGIAGLHVLQQWGIAATAADYRSCRIGDGADMAQHGRISYVNHLAHALGCQLGMAVMQAAQGLRHASRVSVTLAPTQEARQTLRVADDGTPQVVGADSVSLVDARDDGLIVVTASHGECLAGLGGDGVRAVPRLVTFNDAGMGKARAGTGRLPYLQQRGIAAVTVSAQSARIGEARSCYETGVISCVNAHAHDLGCRVGMSLRTTIENLLTRDQALQESTQYGGTNLGNYRR